jgi:penicillin-binding protein 2
MVSNYGRPPQDSGGIDRMKLRLAVLGVLVIAAFVALFSRLWFLQVLASEEYEKFAEENRVRFVYSEPSRGRILDRNGKVLVRNRFSLSATIDKQVVDEPRERRIVLRRLSEVLDIPVEDLRRRLNDVTVSPYKPVAVANDISEKDDIYISVHEDRFPGVDTEILPVRTYPHEALASHVLGYVGEISPDELKDPHFKNVKPAYGPGDLIGKEGVEYAYDKYLRGKPRIQRVIVNSASDVVTTELQQEEDPGQDLVLSLDLGIQRVTENALAAGLQAARVSYAAPAGAVVVMDPQTGGVLAMASQPEYDPTILADGLTTKEYASLGQATPDNPDDDAFLNRPTQVLRNPGSTFKVVTAGAAMATGVADPFAQLECAGSEVYPPEGGPGSISYSNWTSAHNGFIGFPESLEISCNTFYYELGWRLEEAFGASNGDGSEKYQKYARQAGVGHETGIDLRYEADGLVPDKEWLDDYCEDIESVGCDLGWVPGLTVNMSIGQGDVIVSPLQMAVTYAAIANGGEVVRPRLGWELTTPMGDGLAPEVNKTYKPQVVTKLPLDTTELGVIQDGLQAVVSGDAGTAVSAFAGFPLDRFPLAGKTGTAQIDDENERNDAWFVSYGPVDSPQYVIAVLVQDAGHGGESAAPIARQVWEGIFDIDKATDVRLGSDSSG